RLAGHAIRLVPDGDVLPLDGVIYHDDRKPLARWWTSQQRYAREDAEYLLNTPSRALRRNDKIRLMAWPAPIVVLCYTLFVQGCIFDGWAGWYYALQRAIAEMLLAIEIIDQWLRGSDSPGGADSASEKRDFRERSSVGQGDSDVHNDWNRALRP